MLRKSSQARHSKLPLPAGYTWDDIAYVIGGANKKARYIDLQGNIITSAKNGTEAKTQYNLEDGSWSFYHKGEIKPYTCAQCHVTAYNPEGNQDDRPGIAGTWIEDGIGCEACHGPGKDHTQTPSTTNISKNSSAKACGKCHQRGGINSLPLAKGGFIRHHEQVNELLAGGHRNLSCMDCHDPHKRAILTNKNCNNCHQAAALSYKKNIHAQNNFTCSACHMPKMAKSAISVNQHMGDVRSHLFTIDTNPDAKAFSSITKNGKTHSYATGIITVNFSCLGCHLSRDINWASSEARKIH